MKKKAKENKTNENTKNENKVKFSEKLAITFKRKWLVTKTKTFLIVAILFATYIAINLWASKTELPVFDATENKIYSLTDASKKAIEKIDQDVTMYVYGHVEEEPLIDLLNQYTKINEKIKYEIITEESNYDLIKEYGLQEGYTILIMKSGESKKIIDTSTDFVTYDYTTYQAVDTTEQTLTNSMLGLITENKPKVYFVQGHGEYDNTRINWLTTQLNNEAYETSFVSLPTAGKVPDDCDILAIISPSSDLLELEAQYIKDYINKGGNIFFSMDVVAQDIKFPNLQSVLDLYGVTVKNGYALEYKLNRQLSETPYIFMPEVSSTHQITKDIYTDSSPNTAIWLVYAAKLEYHADSVLKDLKVTKENLLKTSEETAFIKDLNVDLETAAKTAETGVVEIASILSKDVTTPEDKEEKKSELIIVSSASFISDYTVSELNQSYPLSWLGSNSDFVINSMAYLAGKDNILTIRKDFSTSTYTPTMIQNLIVIILVVGIPLLIILIGVIVWAYRKRRK